MSQEIEIEFKNLLTKKEFLQLKKDLQLVDAAFITQHNDYFDTLDFSLKKQKAGLRIREKQGRFVLTLKEPHEVGRLETHQTLSEEEVQAFMNDRVLKDGDVQSRLVHFDVNPEDLCHLGRLTTNRAELEKPNSLLVLDHSLYFDKEDFELEWEFTDYETGEHQFESLLKMYHIPKRATQNKIIRFFNYKMLKEKESGDELN